MLAGSTRFNATTTPSIKSLLFVSKALLVFRVENASQFSTPTRRKFAALDSAF